MELNRILSELFNEQAEDVNRILIVTKSTSKNDIEKFEKTIKKDKTETDEPKSTKTDQPKSLNRLNQQKY